MFQVHLKQLEYCSKVVSQFKTKLLHIGCIFLYLSLYNEGLSVAQPLIS